MNWFNKGVLTPLGYFWWFAHIFSWLTDFGWSQKSIVCKVLPVYHDFYLLTFFIWGRTPFSYFWGFTKIFLWYVDFGKKNIHEVIYMPSFSFIAWSGLHWGLGGCWEFLTVDLKDGVIFDIIDQVDRWLWRCPECL